jgi:hypothetical protein
MKFSIDGNQKFELLDWHKSLIKNDIRSDIFDADMKRRATYSVDMLIHKLVHSNKEKFLKQLKSLEVKEVPGKLEDLTEFIGSRDDMGLQSTEMTSGVSLECDSVAIHSISAAYLNLAKTYFQKSEMDYLTDQLEWAFNEKIKGCLRRMHAEWDPKLSDKSISIPLDDEIFVNLVISQPDYKDRSSRDAEAVEV